MTDLWLSSEQVLLFLVSQNSRQCWSNISQICLHFCAREQFFYLDFPWNSVTSYISFHYGLTRVYILMFIELLLYARHSARQFIYVQYYYSYFQDKLGLNTLINVLKAHTGLNSRSSQFQCSCFFHNIYPFLCLDFPFSIIPTAIGFYFSYSSLVFAS